MSWLRGRGGNTSARWMSGRLALCLSCVLASTLSTEGAHTALIGGELSPAAPALLATAHAKSKKAPKSSAASVAMSKFLEDQGTGVLKCSDDHALKKGATKVEIDAKVTVTNRGQVIGAVVNVKVEKSDKTDKGEKLQVQRCIEQMLRALRFPPGDAPLTTLQREWTIS